MRQFSYHTLHLPNTSVRFGIAVDLDAGDPIGQSIADRTYSFPWPHRLAFVLLRPGGAVVDLGAHIGTFSFGAAALGCRVVAVEASPRNVDLLKAGAARNGFDGLRVVGCAASDAPGMLRFVQAGPYGLVANPIVKDSETVEVSAIAVDDVLTELGIDSVDLIKMDVEGSEVRAVRGMARLLARADAPPIVYECNGHTLNFFGETPNRLMALLEQYGYMNYLIEPGRLVPARSGDLQAECNVDYLAVKRPPGHLKGWTISSPLTPAEVIARVLATCEDSNAFHRAYIARALAGADESIRSEARVIDALVALSADPDPDVRQAVSWFERDWPKEAVQVLDRIIQDARRQHDEQKSESAHPRAFVLSLNTMQRKVWVNAHWSIAWPHWPPGVRAKLVAAWQKVTRRLLSWYINPIVRQQNEFNRAALGAVEALAREVLELRAGPAEARDRAQERLDALAAKIDALQTMLEDGQPGQR